MAVASAKGTEASNYYQLLEASGLLELENCSHSCTISGLPCRDVPEHHKVKRFGKEMDLMFYTCMVLHEYATEFLILLELHGFMFVVVLFKATYGFDSLASQRTADNGFHSLLPLTKGTTFLVFALLSCCQGQVRLNEPN